jgi:hypothetical protein
MPGSSKLKTDKGSICRENVDWQTYRTALPKSPVDLKTSVGWASALCPKPYALRIYGFMNFPHDFLGVSLTIAQNSVTYLYFPVSEIRYCLVSGKFRPYFQMPYQPAYIANIWAYLPTYMCLNRRYLLTNSGALGCPLPGKRAPNARNGPPMEAHGLPNGPPMKRDRVPGGHPMNIPV